MQKKLCPVCRREVCYIVHHLHNLVDQLAVLQLKNGFAGWTEDEGMCLICLERFRHGVSPNCIDIRISYN